MATVIPIILVGNNLGQRHKYLNSLVNETYKNGEDFEIIKSLPEGSHIDRLFKIDLACKTKDVDYIVQTLKDDDMLYVSRALKSKWLLDSKYEEIMNPKYLENQVYPEMITTAVNKMQHWIHLNLNDELRCYKFFQYYQEINFNLAFKYLLKCSKYDVEKEFNKIIYKVTPLYLKVLSEKSRVVTKIFFDSIGTDVKVKRLYLTKQNAYFNILRHFLKTDPDLVLDITEKYFNNNETNRFSPMQSTYVLKNHKNRFWKKPELYTSWLLNIQAVADSLNSEEARELVLKLARARYLANWFDYNKVEPLIKRLKLEEQADFKNQVFVEKSIGDIEKRWPYLVPEPPEMKTEFPIIFYDGDLPAPSVYIRFGKKKVLKSRVRPIYKRKSMSSEENCEKSGEEEVYDPKLLENLFDEYKFVSFEQTLIELRKRIAAETSPKHREFMMSVLISKTKERPDAIALLLELLERHSNEPVDVRASVIRSLVKQTQVWRLPQILWNQFMKFSQGLGLDGKEPEAECYEGLHAVVIRNLLQNRKCEPEIKKEFFNQFSDLSDYNFNASEKKIISEALPNLIFEYVEENEEDIYVAVCYIDRLVETLKTYKIKIDTYPGLIDVIIKLANKNSSLTNNLIQSLFNAKIARKQLFPFTCFEKDECYLNALKHDITILDENKFVDQHLSVFIKRADTFFRKMSVYFSEKNGIANKFLKKLTSIRSPSEYFSQKDNSYCILGRYIAFLLNDEFKSYLNKLKNQYDQYSKLLSSAIKANINLARPTLDINAIGWKTIGPKHVANKLTKCRIVDIDNNIRKLLKWRRTAKCAFVLSKRTNYENEIFAKLAVIKPMCALKTGLKLLKQRGDKVNLLIWETIKPIIQKLEPRNITYSSHMVKELQNIDAIPLKIKPEYTVIMYTLFQTFTYAITFISHAEILLPEVEEQFIENIITEFLQDSFTFENLCDKHLEIMCNCMYVRILVKYVLLCKNEEEQKRKFAKYIDPFLVVLEQLRLSDKKKNLFDKYFEEFFGTLKYSKVLLSTQYVLPLPVIEKITIWMKKHYPMEEHFNLYAVIHLLMVFYKTVQQALKISPDVFSDEKQIITKGVEIAGNIFGQYIASEVANLQEQYFESVPELYVHGIMTFFKRFYSGNYLSSELLFSIIQGLIEKNINSAYRLAIQLMGENLSSIYLSQEHHTQIVKYLRNVDNIEAQCFLSAFLM